MSRKLGLGDVVTIAREKCLNPHTGKDTGLLRYCLVTSLEQADGTITVNGIPGKVQVKDVLRDGLIDGK